MPNWLTSLVPREGHFPPVRLDSNSVISDGLLMLYSPFCFQQPHGQVHADYGSGRRLFPLASVTSNPPKNTEALYLDDSLIFQTRLQ